MWKLKNNKGSRSRLPFNKVPICGFQILLRTFVLLFAVGQRIPRIHMNSWIIHDHPIWCHWMISSRWSSWTFDTEAHSCRRENKEGKKGPFNGALPSFCPQKLTAQSSQNEVRSTPSDPHFPHSITRWPSLVLAAWPLQRCPRPASPFWRFLIYSYIIWAKVVWIVHATLLLS